MDAGRKIMEQSGDKMAAISIREKLDGKLGVISAKIILVSDRFSVKKTLKFLCKIISSLLKFECLFFVILIDWQTERSNHQSKR